jgi:hypothetical protein
VKLLFLVLAGTLYFTNFELCNLLFNYDTERDRELWTLYRNGMFSASILLSMLAFYSDRNTNTIKVVYDMIIGALIADIFERVYYKEAVFHFIDLLFIFTPLLIDIIKKLWNKRH